MGYLFKLYLLRGYSFNICLFKGYSFNTCLFRDYSFNLYPFMGYLFNICPSRAICWICISSGVICIRCTSSRAICSIYICSRATYASLIAIYLINCKLISHSYHIFLMGLTFFEVVNLYMHVYFLIAFPPLKDTSFTYISIMLWACLIVLFETSIYHTISMF